MLQPAPPGKPLVALNTHAVGYAGIALGVLGIVADPRFTPILLGLFPPNDANDVAKVVTLAGLILAYFSRPKTIS